MELKSIQLRYLDNFYSFPATFAFTFGLSHLFHPSEEVMLMLPASKKFFPVTDFSATITIQPHPSSVTIVERETFSENILTQFSSILFEVSSACLDDKLLIQLNEANKFESWRLENDVTMRLKRMLALRR